MSRTYGICIPVFNGAKRLNYLFESLNSFSPMFRNRELDVVVSNDRHPEIETSEETKKVCDKWGVKYVELDKWSWASANTDNAIKHCNADVVMYLNDDLIVSDKSIEIMVEFWERNKFFRLGAVGFMVLNAWELETVGIIERENFYPPVWNDGMLTRNAIIKKLWENCPKGKVPEFGYFEEPQLSCAPTGWAFAIDKRIWEKVGGVGNGGVIEAIGLAIWEAGYLVVNIQTPALLHAQGCASMEVIDKHFFHNTEVSRIIGRSPMPMKQYKERWGKSIEEHTEEISEKYVENKDVLKMVKGMWYWGASDSGHW